MAPEKTVLDWRNARMIGLICLFCVISDAMAESNTFTLNGKAISENSVTINASDVQQFQCTSKDSSNGTNITWLLDGANITSFSQGSTVETTSGRTTVSVLNYSFSSRMNGKLIQCCITSQQHPQGYKVGSRLNVQYFHKPITVAVLSGSTILKPRETLKLLCNIDSNPEPDYITWHRDEAVLAEKLITLSVTSTMYKNEGEYWCEAKTALGHYKSDRIAISVSGEPSFESEAAQYTARVDDDVKMDISFCSKPRYHTAYWEWDNGDQRIDLTKTSDGSVGSHFKGEIMAENSDGTCFKTELLVLQANQDDVKQYTFVVNNGGRDAKYQVSVMIKSGISSPAVLIPIFSGLALIIIVLGIIAYLRKIWCFRLRKKRHREPDDEENLTQFGISAKVDSPFGKRNGNKQETQRENNDCIDLEDVYCISVKSKANVKMNSDEALELETFCKADAESCLGPPTDSKMTNTK